MKKLLSIILVLSIVMSVSCLVSPSVSAENIETWPYYFDDFEDESKGGMSAPVAPTFVAGVGGVGKAAQFDIASSGTKEFKIANMSGIIRTGAQIRVSLDFKLGASNSVTNGNYLEVFMHYLKEADGVNVGVASNGYITTVETGERPKLYFDATSTEWQHLEGTWTYNGPDVLLNGGSKTTTKIILGSANVITFDNFEIKVANEIPEPVSQRRDIYFNDFSNGATNGLSVSSGNGTLAVVDVADGADGSANKVLQLADNDTTARTPLKIVPDEPLYYNTQYVLTFNTRILDAYANEAISELSMASGDKYGQVQTAMRVGVGLSSSLSLNQVKTHSGWYNVRFVFEAEGTEGATLRDYIDIDWWIKRQGSGSDTAVYQFDNIKLEIAEGLENGNFEVRNSDFNSNCTVIKTPDTTDAATWNSTYGFVAESGASIKTDGLGDAASNDASRGAIFYYTDLNAKIYDTVSLTPGTRYNITGYTKAGSRDSAGPVQIGIDWDDGTESSVITTVKNNKAQEWKKADGIFTVPENCTGEGKIWIKHLEAEAGDETQDTTRLESSSGNLCFYTDNWMLCEVPTTNVPKANVSATVDEDALVTVSVTNENPAETTVKNVTKLVAVKNGVKYYIGSTTASTITIPEAYRTGYDVAVEVLPICSNGYVGAVAYADVPEIPSKIIGTTLSFDESNNVTIASDKAIENAVLIWAAYDADKRLTSCVCSSDVVNVSANDTTVVNMPSTFVPSGEIRAFLWSDITEYFIPLADAISKDIVD